MITSMRRCVPYNDLWPCISIEEIPNHAQNSMIHTTVLLCDTFHQIWGESAAAGIKLETKVVSIYRYRCCGAAQPLMLCWWYIQSKSFQRAIFVLRKAIMLVRTHCCLETSEIPGVHSPSCPSMRCDHCRNQQAIVPGHPRWDNGGTPRQRKHQLLKTGMMTEGSQQMRSSHCKEVVVTIEC